MTSGNGVSNRGDGNRVYRAIPYARSVTMRAGRARSAVEATPAAMTRPRFQPILTPPKAKSTRMLMAAAAALSAHLWAHPGSRRAALRHSLQTREPWRDPIAIGGHVELAQPRWC